MRVALRFRRATERDLDRLVDLHFAAYPGGGYDEVTRRRHFTHNPLGALRDVIVAEHEGVAIAHAFLLRLRAGFGGVPVKVGGIASVAVAPEWRGRGIGAALMERLHVASDARGDAITMLYAFRQGYYARLGYAATSSRKRLAIDARAIPAAWVALARERVRGVRGQDVAAIRRAHARLATRSSGLIARPAAFWERFFAKSTRLVLVSEPGARATPTSTAISGYAAFQLEQDEDHSEQTLVVDELVADDDVSRRALFGALGAMRDQVTEIVVEVPESDPLERALVDPDGRRFGSAVVEHPLGEIVGGPMVRIEDVPRAIEARGYAAPGAFDVVVIEGSDEADVVAVGVRVTGGRAEVGPAGRSRGRGAHLARALQTTRAGLAAILYGGLSVTDAVALGLADVDPDVASRIDAIVRLAPMASIDAF